MHLSRLMLTGTTLLALSLVGGCSDDSDTQDTANKEPAPTASNEQEGAASSKSRDCKVDVAVSGDVEASWKGPGQAQVQKSASPPAFYQAAKGKNSIAVYAEGGDFQRSAVVTVNGNTYTTEQGASGVDAEPNGKAATVDADAGGVKPNSLVHIVASFTC